MSINTGFVIAIGDADKLMDGVNTPMRLEIMDSIDILSEAGMDWINWALQDDWHRAHEALKLSITNSDLMNATINTVNKWNNIVAKQRTSNPIDKEIMATKRIFTNLIRVLIVKSGLSIDNIG